MVEGAFVFAVRLTATHVFICRYNIEITVTDQQLSASKDFTITVVNRNDQPKFVAQSYTFSVDEDASANTDVGTVTATDEDAATSITYSVSPDTVFRVIPTTGVIQLIAANLNFEATPSYVWLWTLGCVFARG